MSAAGCNHAGADDLDRVAIQANVNVSHDSNVAHSSAALAALRGVRPEDSIISPAVSIDLSLPIGWEEVFLKGSAGYNIYARNNQLNSQDVDLRGGVAARLRACKATLTGSVASARTDLSQLAVTVTRNIETTETVTVEGECAREIGLGPALSVTQQWSSNSSPQMFQSDSRSTSVNAGLAYRRPQFGKLEVLGSFAQADFPNRSVALSPASIQDGYRQYGVGARYERRLGARVQGAFEIGYTTLTPFVRSVEGYSGPYYRADASVRISPRVDAQLQAGRTIEPANVTGATYDLKDLVSGAVNYTVTPKLRLSLSGSQATDSYNGGVFAPGLDVRRQTMRALTVTSHWQLTRRAALELWAMQEVGNADLKSYDYTDNRAGLSVSVRL